MKNEIVLPFSTPRQIETVSQFIATLQNQGVKFSAEMFNADSIQIILG